MSRKQYISIPSADSFAGRLRLLMEEHGDKNQTLQNLLGVSRQSIAYYLNGQDNPKIENVIKLADYYDVSVDWLLARKGYARSKNADIQSVAKTTLFSQHAIDLITDKESEFYTEYRSKALDFILSNGDYTKVFLDSIAAALGYLEESAQRPIKFRQLPDPDIEFYYYEDIKNRLSKEKVDALHEKGYIPVTLSYFQEIDRCFSIAQNALHNMFNNRKDKARADIENFSKAKRKKLD